MPSTDHRRGRAALVLCAVLALGGCAAAPAADEVPHGTVPGASELPEPQLALAELGPDGSLVLRDLLTEQSRQIASLDGATTALTTDGRFVFAASPGAAAIVDTGVWTVDHGDHFHYYRSEPRVVGELEGDGEPEVHAGDVLTTVRFSDEVRVLDSDALGRGELREVATIDGPLAEAMPLDGLLLLADGGGTARVVSPDEPRSVLDSVACPEPGGAIRTRVGVAIGCADGAVLATIDRTTGRAELANIPYPPGTPPELRATAFDGRLGRPTVAAVAGQAGAWLLDTRERDWRLVPTAVPLLRVAAVDDDRQHVVALTVDGRVLVLDASGAEVGMTAPLFEGAVPAGVGLTVDAQRAYVNVPEDGLILEIDYADGARIARSFTSTAVFFAETGR